MFVYTPHGVWQGCKEERLKGKLKGGDRKWEMWWKREKESGCKRSIRESEYEKIKTLCQILY